MATTDGNPSPQQRSWQVPGPSSRFHTHPSTLSYRHHRPKTDSATGISYSKEQRLEKGAVTAMDARPSTPIHSPSYGMSSMHFSPTSDYCTDDGHSLAPKSPSYVPRTELQLLAQRLSSLSSALVREDVEDVDVDGIQGGLEVMESALGRTKLSRQLSDSGYVEGHDTQPNVEVEGSAVVAGKPAAGACDTIVTATPLSAARDHVPASPSHSFNFYREQYHTQNRILRQAQSILVGVQRANKGLRRRFADMAELNDKYADQAEDAVNESLTLRSENEALKADLAHNFSELLLLKLSMRMLEANNDSGEVTTKGEITGDMEEWKTLWDDVDARLRERRVTHRVEAKALPGSPVQREDGRPAADKGDWKLDIAKKREGRVQSITIRKVPASEDLGRASPSHNSGNLHHSPDRDDQRRDVNTGSRLGKSQVKVTFDQPSIAEPSPALALGSGGGSTGMTTSAITTTLNVPSTISASSPPKPLEQLQQMDEQKATQTSPVKGAWLELWKSLEEFAGMAD